MPRPSRSGLAVTFALLLAVWVLLVAGLKLHEMLVGIACVVLSLLIVAQTTAQQDLPVHLEVRDIAQVWRLPWYIVQGCLNISWLLIKDLAGQRVGSFYRSAGFRTSKRDPEAIGRTSLATLYTTVSPNFIVIGIDPAQSLLLFHQIERTEVLDMTRALGAQGGLPK